MRNNVYRIKDLCYVVSVNSNLFNTHLVLNKTRYDKKQNFCSSYLTSYDLLVRFDQDVLQSEQDKTSFTQEKYKRITWHSTSHVHGHHEAHGEADVDSDGLPQCVSTQDSLSDRAAAK